MPGGQFALGCTGREHQAAGRRGLGIGEDLGHRAFFHHLTGIQDGHMLADLLHHAHLVGDDDHRDAQFPVDVLDQLQDGVGGVGVQGAGGFVAQQHLGIGCQGPGDGHPLLLAAGELGGIGICLVPQAHQVEKLHSALALLLTGQAAELHGEAHVLQAGALHEQVEALEDHGHVPTGQPQFPLTDGGQLFPLHPGQTLAIDGDGAGSGTLQKIHAPDQRAFAGAGEADDAEDLALADVQVDVLQRVDGGFAGAEGLVQMLDLNDGFTHDCDAPLRINFVRAIKNALGAVICIKGERKPTPRYHLGSHSSSRNRPFEVPSHSCAVTCAHVMTYASAVGHATPGPCSANPSVPLFTNRGSLWRTCLRTLPFIVFCLSVFLITDAQFT